MKGLSSAVLGVVPHTETYLSRWVELKRSLDVNQEISARSLQLGVKWLFGLRASYFLLGKYKDTELTRLFSGFSFYSVY